MEKKVGVVVAFIAVLSGLVAIFKIVPDVEIAIGFITISFGILAVIWTSSALKSLSEGSALKDYTSKFLICLAFLLSFTVWNTTSIIFDWRTTNRVLLYPGYAFITLSFLTFVWASYQILLIGQEFGFSEEASKIKKKIKEKKEKKKTS